MEPVQGTSHLNITERIAFLFNRLLPPIRFKMNVYPKRYHFDGENYDQSVNPDFQTTPPAGLLIDLVPAKVLHRLHK